MPEFLLASEYWEFGTLPALRPSRPFCSGPTLFCAPGPMLWQIRHFLNEISPLATSCAIPAPVDVAISPTATISVLVIMRPFPFGAGPALGKFGPQPYKRRRRSVSTANWPHSMLNKEHRHP